MKMAVCIIALVLLASLSAVANTWTVNIESNLTFSPTPLEVSLNDTVHWVWLAAPHSTTSDSGQTESWDSGVKTTVNSTFDHVFTHTGSFRYFCSLHGGPGGQGMSGIINVVPEPGGLAAMIGGLLVLIGPALNRRKRLRLP